MLKRISVFMITALLALSLASCSFVPFLGGLPQQLKPDNDLPSTVQNILENYSYYTYEQDEALLAKAVVAAYMESTGDRYAYYYTAEEYEALTADNAGENQGVGITITENIDYSCIEIISVLPNSPALEAGVKPGDLIVSVGIGENAEAVSEMGYEMALKKLQGVEGTLCEFSVVRDKKFDSPIEFSIMREKFITQSVIYAVSKADPEVGIVKILEFDLTTPTQFENAMENLIAQGCKKFVYDVRNNPGGDLKSISAVLSFFYNKDDIIIRTQYRDDSEDDMEIIYCRPAQYAGTYKGCSVDAEDIAKYRDYPASILINGNTASAAELFTSGMKDYGLATIVGETTYGKGCMQSIFSLESFGLPGAMKLTTAFYYPPISDNYHDVGISPDTGYTVPLNEEAANVDIYSLLESNQDLDNQLAEAIKSLKNK